MAAEHDDWAAYLAELRAGEDALGREPWDSGRPWPDAAEAVAARIAAELEAGCRPEHHALTDLQRSGDQFIIDFYSLGG